MHVIEEQSWKSENITRECKKLVSRLKHAIIVITAMKIKHIPSKIEAEKFCLLPPGHQKLVYRENGWWQKYNMVCV